MLFQNHPYRKQITIGLAVLVVVGLALYRSDTGHDDYYATSSAQSPGSPVMMDTDGYGLAEESAMAGIAMVKSITPPRDGSVAADIPQEDRLIIKNGSMSLVVDEVSVAVDQITQFTIEHGGFVVTSNIEQSGIRPSGFVTVRIPSDVFDTGLDAVRALGDVQSERVDGRDVTEEYVDLEAQQKNLEATEDQFLKIMKQAVKIADILSVQRELTNVRTQIERLDGRMKYLKESAAFSSLTIHLSSDPEDLPVLDGNNTWKPLATAKDALRDMLDVGVGIADAIIWALVYIPVWIGLWIFFVLGRKVYRKRQQ